MKIRELSSLTALIFLCGTYQYEAFVNTIASSSRKQQPFDQSLSSPITRPYSTDKGVHNRNRRNYWEHHGDDQSISKGRKRRFRRKFERKPRTDFRSNYAANVERRAWLRKATTAIIEKEPGTLVKGKWHELISMIKAWSKYSKIDAEAPLVIEGLIKRLHDERFAGNEEAVADIEIYNLLLDAWCCIALFSSNYKDTHPAHPVTASQRARDILVQLEQNFESTGTTAQPNEASFSLVYDVVLKVEGVAAARDLLGWMEDVSKANDLAKPGQKYYIRLLNKIADSRAENAGELAEGVLRHMEDIEIEPETVCYNIVMKAFTKGT